MERPASVCVTGASGFIATHVVRELLERGHHVRGTVRQLGDPERTAHLRALADRSPGTLELTSADLLDPHGFDSALTGCPWLVHTASPLQLRSREPRREIVEPALLGTRHVLAAAIRTGVRRVVMTSSIAAMRDDARPPEHLITEADWNESATLHRTPYPLSKTLAEREAWAIRDAQPPEQRFDLVTINPTIVLGPIHSPRHAQGSVAVLMSLLRGRVLAAPRLQLALVDVRDVARAHVEALERPAASGRHILYARSLWMLELADIMRNEYSDRRLPRRELPDWMMYAATLFERRIGFAYLRSHLGVTRRIDGTRACRELGIDYLPIERTVLDTCRSLVEHGLVRPRSF